MFERIVLLGLHQTWMGSLKSTKLPFSRIAISSYLSEVTSALIAHYDHTPFCISAGTNKDDLE